MNSFGMDMFGEIAEVLVDVQTELVFFTLAFATHLLFFSRLRVTGPKGKKVADERIYPSSASTSPMKQHKKGAPNSKPNSSLAALKAALRADDAKSALALFEELHNSWQQSESPSSAPRGLMEQLVKVARRHEPTQLLELLAKLGLLASTLELVLADSAEHGDATTLKKAQQLGLSQGVQFTTADYQALIKGASTCGTPQDADELMREAKRDGMADVAVYNTYVSALVKWGKKEEVRKVMESMKASGLHPNACTFNKLLEEAASSNGNVLSIMNEMKAVGVKPDQTSCTILLKSGCSSSKATNLDKVMEILDDLDGEMDEVLFCAIVDSCVRVGRADLMKTLLAKQRATKLVTLKSPHAYGSVIRAYGYVQDMRGVWDTWHEMKKQHVVPISVTLGCMVEALVTNGDVEGAYESIQEMRCDEKTAPLVNAIIYGSIIKGFSHNKCFNRVWEVYDEMRSQKLQFSMNTYNALIDTCARSKELDRIPSLLKDIEAQGLKLGVVTYSTLVKGYCQTNMLDEAFDLFAEVEKSEECQPDEIMYNTLLDGCARLCLYTRGMALFDKMKNAGVRPSNYTLSVLVKLANRGKRINKAFELCEELTSTYRFRMNVHVFANLIQACIAHNDLPRALGVLEQMLQERVRPDVRTYSLLLRACIEQRKSSDAAGLLRAATGVGEPHPQLTKFGAAMMQPQGGLPADLVSEIVVGIMDSCHNERLAASVFLELGRVRGLKLDPKLRFRLAARMSDM